jgi:hypothetical protein
MFRFQDQASNFCDMLGVGLFRSLEMLSSVVSGREFGTAALIISINLGVDVYHCIKRDTRHQWICPRARIQKRMAPFIRLIWGDI